MNTFAHHMFTVSSALLALSVGCATSADRNYKVAFDQDVSVYLENDETKAIKRGETIDLPVAPVTVARPNHKTVVLLPVPEKSGTLQIRLPREDAIAMMPQTPAPGQDAAQTVVGTSAPLTGVEMNRVAQAVIEIQSLLLERRADEALTRIQMLRDRYAGFSYLRFLEASCFMVKADLEKARELAQQAMKDFPDDTAGRAFLEELERGTTGAPNAAESH